MMLEDSVQKLLSFHDHYPLMSFDYLLFDLPDL